MRLDHSLSAVALLLALGMGTAHALDPQLELVTRTEAYRIAHPGERARLAGLFALTKGRDAEARQKFLEGARFADKLSQFMLAQMYWEGVGGDVDRPVAYAWADLAAERGSPTALARRESIWESLDAAEREQALTVGRPLYRRYGDDAAKPRLEAVMRRNRNNVTGSRLGWVGTLRVCLAEEQKAFVKTATGDCPNSVSGETYYADVLWKPQQYWAMQDVQMERELAPKVDIGPLQSMDPASIR